MFPIAASVAILQDRRQAAALPQSEPQRQHLAAGAGRIACYECTHAARTRSVVLQRRVLRFACPVNCIHLTPDEPGFATRRAHIDPVACVDCGACVPLRLGQRSPNNSVGLEQLPPVEIASWPLGGPPA